MAYRASTLDYNTEREKLRMPEYGRNILKMVEHLKEISDREQRTRQAYAVVGVMKSLNPSVANEENWEQKLWDHLFMIADFDLDVDSPYPVPQREDLGTKPDPIPLKTKPVKAAHYGRNIESIIDLISEEPDGDQKTQMIRQLASYMRQQYLIWNKDSVADETIFNDIVKLSDGRISIPEGLELPKIDQGQSYAKPGMNMDFVGKRSSGKKSKNGKKR